GGLRRTGGARGVLQQGGVGERARDLRLQLGSGAEDVEQRVGSGRLLERPALQERGRRRERRLVGQEVAVLGDYHRRQLGLRADRLDHRVGFLGGDEGERAGVVQLVQQLDGFVHRIEAYRDAACAQRAVVGDRKLRRVFQEEGDPVPRREAARLQETGESSDRSVELGEGDCA